MPGQQVAAPKAIPQILAHVSELRRNGQHRDSIRCLTQALADWPGNGRLQLALSISHRLAGDYEESLYRAETILARQPENPAALLARVETLAAAGDLQLAMERLEQALRLQPDHLPLQLRMGVLLRQIGRPSDSAARLAALADQHPADATILRALAISWHAAGNAERCLELCAELLKHAPQDAQIRLLQIAALERLQHFDRALDLLNGFLLDAPGHLSARLRRADLLRKQGRCREAIADLASLSPAHRDSAPFRITLARCHQTVGDDETGLELLEAVLRENPADHGALLLRIDSLQQLGAQDRLEDALRSVGSQLESCGAAHGQNPFVSVICKGIRLIPRALAAQLLDRHAASIVAAAPALPPRFLWAVYDVAEQLGMSSLAGALADILLAHEDMDIAVASMIVTTCFRVGLPNWRAIALHLEGRLPPHDRNTLQIETESLDGLPGPALARRKSPPAQPRPARVMLIARLLKQQGRIRVAARYLGFARRVFGQDPALLQEHAICLCGSGQVEAARKILAEAANSTQSGLAWREAIAAGWAEVDETGQAVRLLDATPLHRATRNDWYVASVLAGPDRDHAAQLARDLHGQTTEVHFAASIRGQLLTEAGQGYQATGGDLILPAIRLLAEWTDGQADGSGTESQGQIPSRIVQYWSQGKLPPQLVPAVESWRQAGGFEHHLFDRAMARDFLHDRLGLDWLRAFSRAGSATEESDFFRLCHLALEGGIYADCDDWLIGDAKALLDSGADLALYREPSGVLGNNIIIAPPHHPAILWAAVAAKRALLDRHGESTWAKTGPGLLTRAAAHHVAKAKAGGARPLLRIMPRWMLGGIVQYHSPIAYKFGKTYWNRSGTADRLRHLARWVPAAAA